MARTKTELRAPTYRRQRLKLAWLLAPPFLLLSRPTPGTLAVGISLAAAALTLRGLAAGSIHKDRELARGGPYARIRHPLFVGSFFLGLSLAVAGGVWWFLPVFLLLFARVYGRAIMAEEKVLERRFGEAFLQYREEVPAFIPRVSRRAPFPGVPGFRFRLYCRNREWEAALGALAGFSLLWMKMVWMGL